MSMKKQAKDIKEWYESKGAIFPLCEKCELIKINETVWTRRISGPTLHTGIMCSCKGEEE